MLSSAFRFGAVLTIALLATGCAGQGFEDESDAASEIDDSESVAESQQALIWNSLGGGLSSGPGVASWAPGRLDVFVRGTDNGLWQKSYDNSVWTDWQSLGGTLTSDPAAVSWGSGRIDLFMRGSDNGLWHRWYNGGWSGWESLGGGLASGPAVASWGPGRLDVFVRGTDNALWTRHYEGGWSGWTSLGGTLTSDPAAVSWGPGRIDVFARGTDNGLYTKSYGPNGWSGWTSLGGVLTSSPTVASQGVGKLDVFVRGADNGLHRRSFNNGWGAWEMLGGTLTSDPEAVSWGPGRVDVFARNSQNALSHTIPTAAQPAPANQVPQTQVAKFFRAHDGSNKPQLSYGRGVGTSPTVCPAGTEESGAFCYPACSSGYYGAGPVCWESCPSGFTDTGAFCTASGNLVVSRNTNDCPFYDVCGLGTSCGGGCPYGYVNTGCTCTAQTFAKQSYGRGVGVEKGCASNLEKDPGGLCYPKCESGYKGVGPDCWLDQIGTNDVCAQLYDSTLASLATNTQQTMNYGFGVGIAADASVGVETGVAYGKGGEYGCYVSWCYGATTDVSISAWGSWGVSPLGFDSVEGPSTVTSVSASASIAGASVGTVVSGGQYAGIVTSLSLGAGVAPMSVSYQNCETFVTQLW